MQEFKERVPELAAGLADKIKKAHKDNPKFETAFGKFFELCQQTLNPNIRRDAVDEMLVQHLLTERLSRFASTGFSPFGRSHELAGRYGLVYTIPIRS